MIEVMRTLQIRGLPEGVYQRLQAEAERQHRSLSQQAAVLLTRALEVSEPPEQRRRRTLKKLAERPVLREAKDLPPPEHLVREDRDR